MKVKLDKERPVRFTHSVIMKVEDERGKSFLNFNYEEMTYGDLIALCYYGCKKADESFNLSIEDVGDHFSIDAAGDVMKAFASDMVKEGEKKK